eukprot:TRINITY_DN46857_c0_g1_i1.p1 TRINITY_DN46857_c0_g1~~TRINITY_DN46857_c0_g1_i1.p1  ORF type:complete len:111 (+),score=26.19 TRINITY_DN46857_c0_g1_i1:84-416(+)
MCIRDRINKSPGFGSALSEGRRSMIVESPLPGMFWEAHHVVAVKDGGGECGVSNLQTLCVPCHAAETRKQHAQWKEQRRQIGEAKKRERIRDAKGERLARKREHIEVLSD